MMKRLIFPMIGLLFGIHPAYGADPTALIQNINSSIHAVSVVDLLSKAGVDAEGHSKLSSVPRLVIVNHCEQCTLSHALRLSMIRSYRDLANKHQLKIQADKTITLVIDDINARNNFLRGLLGVMSGADYIKAHLENTADNNIMEYSISHEEGVELVAQRVGERCLQFVVQAEVAGLNAQHTNPPTNQMPLDNQNQPANLTPVGDEAAQKSN